MALSDWTHAFKYSYSNNLPKIWQRIKKRNTIQRWRLRESREAGGTKQKMWANFGKLALWWGEWWGVPRQACRFLLQDPGGLRTGVRVSPEEADTSCREISNTRWKSARTNLALFPSHPHIAAPKPGGLGRSLGLRDAPDSGNWGLG